MMNKKQWVLFILFCVFGVSSTATSQDAIYRWEDDNGNLFFSDTIEKVPKQYRGSIIKTVTPEKKISLPSHTPLLADTKTDLQGNDRKWWQKLAKRWYKKKRDAEDRIKEIQLEIRQLSSHRDMTREKRVKEELRMKKLLEAAVLRRDLANRMLTEGLPDEAKKAAAPLQWLSMEP